MIVKLEFQSENGAPCERNALGDSIILAVDEKLKGAHWEANGNGWIARK